MKNTKANKKGIILLSSGLDSYLSLCLSLKKCEIILALTFDYGQNAAEEEIEHSKKIASKYNIPHKVIKLPYLKEILDNGLVKGGKALEFETLGVKSMESVWVPNRNGLFLNIAGMYADKYGADYIIYGSNKEEAATFCDNSKDFNRAANRFFKFSTLKKPKILSPLQNYEKFEMINIAKKENLDFSLIKSCYNSKKLTGKVHCKKCESCKRLYGALIKSGNKDLINLIF